MNYLYQKKIALESNDKDKREFMQSRDKFITFIVLITTLVTTGMICCSPALLFPKWFTVMVIVMIITRIFDFTLKKEHFFLLDFCATAVLQIAYFVMLNPTSFSLGLRCFAFGAGILNWSSVLLGNSFVVHRLDEFSSLWIHMIPSILVYTLRWYNEGSAIYYKTVPCDFTWDLAGAYIKASFLPYLLWFIGYYLIISKVFKSLTVEGDYMTLAKLLIEKVSFASKVLDCMGTKYRHDIFMMLHFIYFIFVTFLSYFSFFYYPLHTFSICVSVLMALYNGSKKMIKNLNAPREKFIEELNKALGKVSSS